MSEIDKAKEQPPVKRISLQEMRELSLYLASLGEGIYPIIRAINGLPPQDDPTYGLINRDDPRETGLLNADDIRTHVAWEVAGKRWPVLRMFDIVRSSDLPYEKTLDGKNWVLTAALVGKNAPNQPGTNVNIGLPNFNNPNWTDQNQNGQAPGGQGPPPKKHWWSRK